MTTARRVRTNSFAAVSANVEKQDAALVEAIAAAAIAADRAATSSRRANAARLALDHACSRAAQDAVISCFDANAKSAAEKAVRVAECRAEAALFDLRTFQATNGSAASKRATARATARAVVREAARATAAAVAAVEAAAQEVIDVAAHNYEQAWEAKHAADAAVEAAGEADEAAYAWANEIRNKMPK